MKIIKKNYNLLIKKIKKELGKKNQFINKKIENKKQRTQNYNELNNKEGEMKKN